MAHMAVYVGNNTKKGLKLGIEIILDYPGLRTFGFNARLVCLVKIHGSSFLFLFHYPY